MTSDGKAYPEIVGYLERGRKIPPPRFPETCPACGSAVTEFGPMGAVYACGGAYEMKPQIQNHTDYFWGYCPR